MPARILLDSPPAQALMSQFGERLAVARRAQRLSAVEFSNELGISRNTLAAAERGEPSVTMGTYMRILTRLGKSADFALLAASTVSPAVIARRHERLSREVERGDRDPRTLFAFPADVVARATLEFPEDELDEAEPW